MYVYIVIKIITDRNPPDGVKKGTNYTSLVTMCPKEAIKEAARINGLFSADFDFAVKIETHRVGQIPAPIQWAIDAFDAKINIAHTE